MGKPRMPGPLWSVTLAGGGWDGLLRLWDIGTGELRAVLEGHGEPGHGGIREVSSRPMALSWRSEPHAGTAGANGASHSPAGSTSPGWRPGRSSRCGRCFFSGESPESPSPSRRYGDERARDMNSLRTPHGILLLACLALAASASAEGGLPPADVVLEAGEIDARTVPAGARVVVVVHGRGARHPVSGEWARLDTTAGWVQAVEVSALVLARERDLRQVRIPLDRIHRLVMAGPPEWEAPTDSTGAEAQAEASAREDSVLVPGSASVAVEGRAEIRVLRKVRNGALLGVLGGFAGMAAGVVLGAEDCGSSGGDDPWCGWGAILGALLLGTTGNTVGAAVGVSWEDPHGRFILALAGSAAGVVAGWALVGDPFYVEDLGEFWPLFAAPAVFATLVSELTRNPPEDRRLALRLSPHPGGGFAAAALRF